MFAVFHFNPVGIDIGFHAFQIVGELVAFGRSKSLECGGIGIGVFSFDDGVEGLALCREKDLFLFLISGAGAAFQNAVLLQFLNGPAR